jgi:hypothetical protein
VFWPSGAVPGADRPGTIARSNLHDADNEARAIARDGGTAEVRYMTEDGGYQIIATNRPTPAGRTRSTKLPSGIPGTRGAVLVGLGAIVVLATATIIRIRRRGVTIR